MVPVPELKNLTSGTGTKIKEIIKAFTLVELIVVITILAILATIGFVSYSWYLAWTRDTNRIAQLKSMSDALELYRTKKDLPIPDDKIDIRDWVASTATFAYQGYIGKNVLETIEYTESWLDPKDKQYFSYYLTKNKKYFQLMAFLEEDSDVVALKSFNKTQATDYSIRFPHTQWKKLWIMTDINNTPIQELPLLEPTSWSWYLDISNVWTTEYKSYLKWNDFLSWTGTTFLPTKTFALKWWKFCSNTNLSCSNPNLLVIPTNWLVAEFLFENNLLDSLGNYNWTIVWSPTFVDWKINKSFKINSNWDWAYIDFLYKTKDILTFSLWVKRNSSDTSYVSSVLNWVIGSAEKKIWFRWATNSMSFSINDSTTQKEVLYSNNLSNDKWEYYVWINTWNEIKFYLNTVLISSVDISWLNNVDSLNASWDRKFWIWYSGASGYPYSFIWWELDNFRIYNRALTSEEIWIIYTKEKEQF